MSVRLGELSALLGDTPEEGEVRIRLKFTICPGKENYTPIVRLRVHFSRHCDFNQLSDSDRSIITLFMLIHVKEETLRVIFQPSFSILGTQRSIYRVIRTAKVGRTGSRLLCFAILELLISCLDLSS